jgi:acyl carrier protein
MRILRDTLGIEVPTPQTDLIEAGLLDSLAVVTLVVEVEQLTGMEIPFETLEFDALRSVDAISDLIDRLEQRSA